jgi:putative membrane protein
MSQQPPSSVGSNIDLARHQTNMASYRTQLALDRTTLAWVRTALSMASFGFGMVAFFRSIQQQAPSPETIRLHAGAIRMGTSLIMLGVVGAVFAALSHVFMLRRLRRGESPGLSHWPHSVTVAILIAAIGFVGLWDLFAR